MTQIPNKIFKSVTFVVFVVDLLIVVVVAVGCCWKTVSAVAETAAPPPVVVGVAGQSVHPVGGRQLRHPTYSQLPRGRGPGGHTRAANDPSHRFSQSRRRPLSGYGLILVERVF